MGGFPTLLLREFTVKITDFSPKFVEISYRIPLGDPKDFISNGLAGFKIGLRSKPMPIHPGKPLGSFLE
jgi:hypothetical protein